MLHFLDKTKMSAYYLTKFLLVITTPRFIILLIGSLLLVIHKAMSTVTLALCLIKYEFNWP